MRGNASYRRLKAFVKDFISLRRVRSAWLYVVRLVEHMDDHHIFLLAAGIAFNAIICIVPILLLAMYILATYLDPDSAMATVNSYIDSLRLLPFQREEIQRQVLLTLEDFIRGRSLAGILGVAGLVWTSSALFSSIRTVFNKVFHAQPMSNILVSKLKDFALLAIIGVLFIVVTILSYAISFASELGPSWIDGAFWRWMVESMLPRAMATSSLFIMFCMLFYFVPDKKIPLRVTLLCSTVSLVMWEAAREVFGFYIVHFWKIGRVYGPYLLVAATFFWFYYSSLTIIVAAEIGEMSLERKRLRDFFTRENLLRRKQKYLDVLHQTGLISKTQNKRRQGP